MEASRKEQLRQLASSVDCDLRNEAVRDSDSSERLALIDTSEEMGQARDTSTPVTFNALN